MCRSVRTRQDGFTVIELAVAMGILLMIIGIVLAILISATRTERGEAVRAITLQEANQALRQIGRDLRPAVSVATTSSGSRIDMQTRISGVEHQVVYDVSGTDLRRAVDAGAPTVIARNVTGLAFTYNPSVWTTLPSIVTVLMTVRPPQAGASAITLRTEVKPRNAGL